MALSRQIAILLILGLGFAVSPVIAEDCSEPADTAEATECPNCCETACKKCRPCRCRFLRCCRVRVCCVRQFGPKEAPSGSVLTSVPAQTNFQLAGGTSDRDLLLTLLLAQQFKNAGLDRSSGSAGGSGAGGTEQGENVKKLQSQIDTLREDVEKLAKQTNEIGKAVKEMSESDVFKKKQDAADPTQPQVRNSKDGGEPELARDDLRSVRKPSTLPSFKTAVRKAR